MFAAPRPYHETWRVEKRYSVYQRPIPLQAFVEFFAQETGKDGRLSFEDVQVALEQSRAEYDTYRAYDRTEELIVLSERLALRHALLRTVLADILSTSA